MSSKLHPAIILGEDWEVYKMHYDTHLSSHQLADFRKSPLLYHKKKQGLIPETKSDAFTFGTAVHCYILEGKDVFRERYEVGGPINPKTGKVYGALTAKYAEWKAGHGKETVTDSEYAKILQMAHGVKTHTKAMMLLAQGHPEVVVRGVYGGLKSQIRIDWLHTAQVQNENAIVDLKTCHDLDKFEENAKKYGYRNQMAFYADVYCDLAEAPFIYRNLYIIAIEKQEPFRCGVWQVVNLSEWCSQNDIAIHAIQNRPCNNIWPTGYEDVRSL